MLKEKLCIAVVFVTYGVFVLLALASLAVVQDSVGLAVLMNGPAIIYIFLRVLNVIRSSLISLVFLLAGLGMLEWWLGIATDFPISWAIGMMVVFLSLIWGFVREVIKIETLSQGSVPFDIDDEDLHEMSMCALGRSRQGGSSSPIPDISEF